jgi:hypothetical protein
MRLAIALLLCSCDRTPSFERCTDDLTGVYEIDGHTWNLLDNRRTLEAYPLFDDTVIEAGVEVAPRVLDLRRTNEALVGEVTRRYMRGTARCDAKASARVTSCKASTLEIVLGDPVPPNMYTPCVWTQDAPTRRERWRRVN